MGEHLICQYCQDGRHAIHFVEYRDEQNITRICRCQCPLNQYGHRRNENAAELSERRMRITGPLTTQKESWL